MTEWIWGRNPVYEALRSRRRRAHQLKLARGAEVEGRLGDCLRLAEKAGIPVQKVPRDNLAGISSQHQGLALQVDPYPYVGLDQILRRVEERDEDPLVLLLDTLQDPQNLGSLIRTAELVGVHGVVLPLRRTATITPAAVNASSGATEYMLICQANLAQTISTLKDEGLWAVGLDGGPEGQPPGELNLAGPLAVVVGSEGSGMRRLVRESCDFLMRLPMRGRLDSLNAAVAGSVALYLVWASRDYQGA